MDGDTECTICLSKIDTANTISTGILEIECGHKFHYNCIYNWSIIDNSCPNCRESFKFDTNNQVDFLTWLDLKLDKFFKKDSKEERLENLIEMINTTIRLYDQKNIKCTKLIYKTMLKKLRNYKDEFKPSCWYWIFNWKESFAIKQWYDDTISKLEIMCNEYD